MNRRLILSPYHGAVPRSVTALCFIVIDLCTGCALINTSVQDQPVNLSGACAPQLPPLRHTPAQQNDTQSFPELQGYSPRALHTASILGLSSLPRQLAEEEPDGAKSSQQAVKSLEIRFRLLSRLYVVTEELARVEAEVTCEQGRVQQLTDQLQTLKSRRSSLQTLASIIVSGIASIATGGIGLAISSIAIDIIYICGRYRRVRTRDGHNTSNRDPTAQSRTNLLREVWEGKKRGSQIIPESVWRLLTTAGHDKQNLRTQLLDH